MCGMTLDQLLAFHAVATHGTFSAASKALHKSQPAVSKLVQNLEAELGITLFECLAAHEILKGQGVTARVIDLYSLQPIDTETLQKAAKETGWIVTREGFGRDSTHQTKDAATRRAVKLARQKQPSELVIHRADGTVQDTRQ